MTFNKVTKHHKFWGYWPNLRIDMFISVKMHQENEDFIMSYVILRKHEITIGKMSYVILRIYAIKILIKLVYAILRIYAIQIDNQDIEVKQTYF